MSISNISDITFSRINCENLYSTDPFNFKYLCEILKEDFKSEIVQFISKYYPPADRGMVNNFKVGDEFTIINNTTESLTIECYLMYDVQYYFGCKDIDETDDDEIKVEITLFKSNCNIQIVGDKIFERDPDEY